MNGVKGTSDKEERQGKKTRRKKEEDEERLGMTEKGVTRVDK